MWVPILTAAVTTTEWLLERQKRREMEPGVPVQELTEAYFDAMAEDIESRLESGSRLKDALKEVYLEQAPVLLQPPAKNGRSNWALPVALAAGALVGLGYLRRSRY